MQDFRKMQIWVRSKQLAVAVYRATESMPPADRAVLGDQLRRAVASISGNIAEGAARGGKREFLYFLHVSMGSAAETETYISLAMEVGLIPERVAMDLLAELEEIRRMIGAFMNRVRNPLPKSIRPPPDRQAGARHHSGTRLRDQAL